MPLDKRNSSGTSKSPSRALEISFTCGSSPFDWLAGTCNGMDVAGVSMTKPNRPETGQNQLKANWTKHIPKPLDWQKAQVYNQKKNIYIQKETREQPKSPSTKPFSHISSRYQPTPSLKNNIFQRFQNPKLAENPNADCLLSRLGCQGLQLPRPTTTAASAQRSAVVGGLGDAMERHHTVDEIELLRLRYFLWVWSGFQNVSKSWMKQSFCFCVVPIRLDLYVSLVFPSQNQMCNDYKCTQTKINISSLDHMRSSTFWVE